MSEGLEDLAESGALFLAGNLDFFPTLILLMRKLGSGSRSLGEAEDSVAGVRQAGKAQEEMPSSR